MQEQLENVLNDKPHQKIMKFLLRTKETRAEIFHNSKSFLKKQVHIYIKMERKLFELTTKMFHTSIIQILLWRKSKKTNFCANSAVAKLQKSLN